VNEREKILARIREALTKPAPRTLHSIGSLPKADNGASLHFGARQWLPSVGEAFEQRLDLFRKNLADLKGNFSLVESREELVAQLAALRDAEEWTKIATHSGELTNEIGRELHLPVFQTNRCYDARELESCSVGITQCDALIAQTGSVLVTSRSAGGRALSVFPPHHVILARRSQLLSDLPGAFDFLKSTYAPNYPSFISFITGPSRTGDIERILVLGAHGPKKLTVFCF
jgi:L-lactate dehydrogenase complex protein LldG